jgi:hypothetical protein
MSVAKFCLSEGVSVPSFYQWRKRFAAEQEPVNVKRSVDFAPVRFVNSANVAVHLPGGSQIEIPMTDSRAFELAIQTVVKADAERARGATC